MWIGLVHEAVVQLDDDADERAPGAGVTLALCGAWEHPPPCPLAPHHIAVERHADVRNRLVRIVFAVDPADPAQESLVRSRIEEALRAGTVTGPDGVLSRWTVLSSRPAPLREAELDLAGRLARTREGSAGQ